MDTEAKNKEQRLRRQARRLGVSLRKSRATQSNDNAGGYKLEHAEQKTPLAGHHFDLTLDEVEVWLIEHGAELMP